MSRPSIRLLIIMLLGAAFRIHALGADIRFSPDEALFATFARNAAVNGDWLMSGNLDKPPLALYASAISMRLTAAQPNAGGVLDFTPQAGEFAARLPATLGSILLIALVYALAKRLYNEERIAWWAALFVALSPLGIAYGATALTDGLMLPLVFASLLAATHGRSLWAGVWLGLAFASKPQALYFAPLIFVLLFTMGNGTRLQLARLVVLLFIIIAGLVIWDAFRAPSPSMFALAAANNNPTRLIRSDEVLPRLIIWLEQGRFILGSPTLILAVLIPIAIFRRVIRQPRYTTTAIDLILLIFVLVYFFIHWLIAFNTYDRYLLIIFPILAILAARAALWVWDALRERITAPELVILSGAVILSMVGGAAGASEGASDYNVERRDYAGIIALADYLNDLPTAAIIYDHWLGWELGYYMGAWSDKRRVYYPTPNELARGAAENPETEPRYFPAPADEPLEVWLAALGEAGFNAEIVYERGRFVVYQLVQ